MRRLFGFILFVIVLLMVAQGKTYGQLANIAFDHITIEEGLSQSTVFAISQDANGFMWFGTRDGLNRYDSRRIRIFRNDPNDHRSISNNTIYALLTDRKERLWIATHNGLNLYDAAEDAFHHNFSYVNEPGSNTYTTINCLFEDRSGNIWAGTREGLAMLPKGETLQFLRFRHGETQPNTLVDDDVRSIFQDRNGVMWIGTSQGLSRLDYRDENNYSFTAFYVPGSNTQAKTNWINTIMEDPRGRLLIGTERTGLLSFDPDRAVFEALSPYISGVDSKAVRSIEMDPHGRIWVGTIGGIYILNTDLSLIRKLSNAPENPFSISDNSIRSIFFDNVGSCWVGGFHGGVNFYSPLSNRFKHIKPGPEYPDLRFKVASALAVDSERNLWIGTEGDGVYFLDRGKKKISQLRKMKGNNNSLSHDNVKCFLLEEGKGIWIGTLKGLNYYDFHRRTFKHYFSNQGDSNSLPDDAIYDIKKDSNGDLWIATFRGGLVKFSLETDNTYRIEAFTQEPSELLPAGSEGVTKLYLDKGKSLWAGTLTGPNKKTPGQNAFTKFLNNTTDAGAFWGDYILCIFEDSQDRIWIGTRGSGLNLLQKDGRHFRHLTTADGLPGNSVYGIQEDDKGFLWLSTDNGLSRLDRSALTFKNFTRSDGLVCKEFNFNSFEKDHKGYFYFGGYNGIVYFHPDSIHENITVPPVALTGLRLFNDEIRPSPEEDAIISRDLPFTNKLELRYNQNVFSIEFAVLNYVTPSKNEFAYKLDGFETEWNITNEPVATYMNLQPGTYTLLVKGANNDGVWNEEPVSLTLKIHPPPWKTWWAFAIYFAVFLGLLFAWSRFKEKQVELEHELAIEHLEKEKQDELHRAKLNFFTNIAHEIRTPLTLMIGPVDHINDSLRQNDRLKKDIGLVKKNTDRLMRLLNQLLDFQKQETGNVKLKVRKGNFTAFMNEIVLPFEEFAYSRNVGLHVEMPAHPLPLWFDHDELAKVFSNLLANAFKFTPGGGQVSVKVHQDYRPGSGEDDYVLRIMVEDNGLGISANQLEKIFHRFYQAENTGVHETGFGIGLALSKGIIELHHGEIRVESKEASGDQHGYTRFLITIPGGNAHFEPDQIHDEEVPAQIQMETITSAVEKPCEDKDGQNDKHLILVVEDNGDIREYISRTLKQHHYEVVTCTNGQEGWHAATERLPDLVLTDVMMGGMNGLDLLTHLKGDVRTSHIPVILLTARASVNHQVEGILTGADDYLIKPFNVQLLLAKINNHLAIREKLMEKYCRMVTVQPQDEQIEGPDDKFLKRLMSVLDTNLLDTEFNVAKLSREIGMSRPVLFRKTKMLTGLSVIDLIRSVRLKKAEMLLKQKKLSVSEVAFAVGFNDPKYFSKSFKEQYGKSPSQYMNELT